MMREKRDLFEKKRKERNDLANKKKKLILVSRDSSFRENVNMGGFVIQIRQKMYIEAHKYFYSILFFYF